MIVVEELTKAFGGIVALHGISIEVQKGKITGLIGPNGAGKTTLFNVIAGMFAPDSGAVFFDGVDVTGMAPHVLFHRGLLRTFQIAREFPSLTVRENLMVVPPGQTGESLIGAWFRRGEISRNENAMFERAEEVMDFLTIGHLAEEKAGNLSGGQKKLLELGRTMMADAKVVLLDEVGAGVNPTLLNALADAIARLNTERGYTFCMIEHNFSLISRLCDPVIVMADGKFLAEGTADEIRRDERVIEAYLGSGHTETPDAERA
ncbi:MAG: ABC transporter ATP-binding protein [Albidovulum sp.]|nr:ABC transporter ATP-binding protein [Albidovulum sp.]MDE0531079.1 ABC transporter ATP-binding protein [Albidovulum sp.]